MNQIVFHFGQEGLIFFCKSNEYYRVKPLSFDEIMLIYNTLESNPQFQNLENKTCYLSCCLYLLARYDEKYTKIFGQKIFSVLSLKNNPINDSYLFLIYNCIDFDENFLHSDKKKLEYLLKYLEKFSFHKKTKENYLLYKYYRGILQFRLGNIEETSKESIGIILNIEDEKNKNNKYMDFIELKNKLFQIKLMEAKNDSYELQENYNLLRDVYEIAKKDNPFLALKLGFSIYNNLYKQNLFKECIQILQQMNLIIKNYEKQGVHPKKLLRFGLSVYCRTGLIGLLLSNKKLVDFAINEITKGLLLIKNDTNNKNVMSIFKAYTFALTLLKLNCNIYVDNPERLSNIFIKEFIFDKFNNEGKYLGDSYCINNQNINQCIISLNALNNNSVNWINEKAQKIIDYYISIFTTPGKNLLSNDVNFIFIVGLFDRIRFFSEKYLRDKNQYSQEKYKAQILRNSDTFWRYINGNAQSEPLLQTDFFKSIIIKIFSCCIHIFYYNKDFNRITSSINQFDNLSKLININENTPSYELVYKAKGDYYFRKNDYKTSINYYNNSIQRMKDKNPRKPAIFFNLGILYYYLGDKKSSVFNFEKAAEYFKKADEEKSTFDIYKRNDILSAKYNFTRTIIKEIKNQ